MLDLTKLDLRKELILNITKTLNIEGIVAEVILALDFSGSMSRMYSDGTVQETLERLLPLGLKFDDNGAIGFYLFDDKFRKLDDITQGNFPNASKIASKYQMGGTNYSPVINEIVKENGTTVTKGFFGLGKKSEPKKNPTFVIFITDGENGDHSDAEKAIKEASHHPIFFQFVGIGHSSFSFLEKLDTMGGRYIDNAGFFKIQNLNQISDEQLYNLLLKEFPSWIKEAKNKGLIS